MPFSVPNPFLPPLGVRSEEEELPFPCFISKKGKYTYALTRGLARDGEERGDPQGGPPGDRVDVHPEGDPGDDHDEDGGEVRLDHVEAEGAAEVELGQQAAVVSCEKNDIDERQLFFVLLKKTIPFVDKSANFCVVEYLFCVFLRPPIASMRNFTKDVVVESSTFS